MQLGLICLVLLVSLPTHASDLDNIFKDVSKILPLVIKNEEVGNLFASSMDKQHGLSSDQVEINRVQTIGNKIAATNNLKEYEFAVLNGMDFNACSIYGRKVRVFHGLVSDTRNSDSELAAVVAHEIAHQELGHNKRMVESFKIQYGLNLAKIKTPGIINAAANAVLAKRSREFEQEADHQMLKYLTKSGVDPRGAIAVFRRIEAEHKLEQQRSGKDALQLRFDQIFSTHPEPSARAQIAEDYLFEQKYGNNFRQVAGAKDSRLQPIGLTNNRLTGNLPIIMAHASQWDSPLTTPREVSGTGIFNPASILGGGVIDELISYFSLLGKGKALCLTCDNDTHGPGLPGAGTLYTYINIGEINKASLLQAIREGRTYATKSGIRIYQENFQICNSYPKVEKVSWSFKLDLPSRFLVAPKIKVFRGNKEVAELKKVNAITERQPEYRFEDKNLKSGSYWYVLAIPGELVTSPITVEVTGNPNDRPIVSSNWRKGIVHFHSTYSDNHFMTPPMVATDCRLNDVEFIFMTDHADKFDKAKYQRYINECRQQSPLMIPGVEWPLTDVKQTRHLLVLGLEKYLPYQPLSEEEFFGNNLPEKLLLISGPFHLGDDFKDSTIINETTFIYAKTAAKIKLRIKGSPFKDPILWVNRHEIGRVVTTDNKWHWFEFPVKAEWLNDGQNLFHIESFIPNRWNTFDDCEVADVYIVKTKASSW